MSKKEEAEILVPMSVEAVPVDQADSTLPPFGKVGESPVPLNHNRFYCNKCHTPYDLPFQTTSWRCANCHTFNSTTPGQCENCVIL